MNYYKDTNGQVFGFTDEYVKTGNVRKGLVKMSDADMVKFRGKPDEGVKKKSKGGK